MMEDKTLFWVAFVSVLEVGGGMAGMFILAYLIYELTKR